MKKGSKVALGCSIAVLSIVLLASCTANFCSVKDQASMLYAFDYGITNYYDGDSEDYLEVEDKAEPLEVEGYSFNNVYITAEFENSDLVYDLVETAVENTMRRPSVAYFKEMDNLVLKFALDTAQEEGFEGVDFSQDLTASDIITVLDNYGYLKYYDSFVEEDESPVLWANWYYFNGLIRQIIEIDEYPDNDFISYYVSSMNSNISSYRSCIATHTGEYGYYGYGSNKAPITIEGKTWRYAWSEGFLEGLLVYPIAWCVDGLVDGFASLGMDVAKGGPQVLAIVIITLSIRLIFALATLKPTLNNQKMQALQPEIQKIQQKYPNSKDNRRDQELMAMEQQKLYKKYHIRPWVSFVVMIIQFPIFICVWGALSGSAYLSSGAFLGLRLSDTMYSVMFSGANWSTPGGGALTALIIFLLMAGMQVIGMLLPQLLQRKNRKKVAKLNKNPSGDRTQNRTRIFQWVMIIMIIIMGFMLAAGMAIYWLVGPVVNIIQTLVMDYISKRQMRKQKYEKYRKTTSTKKVKVKK